MRIETSSTLLTDDFLTNAQAKLHCRIDVDDDDAWIAEKIIAARKWIEAYVDGVTIPQTLTVYYDPEEVINFDRSLLLPKTPALSITSITSYDNDDAATVFSSVAYYRSGNRIALRNDYDWPTDDLRDFDALKIIYIAGYGTLSGNTWTQVVPNDMTHAARLLIAHWYQNRGDENASQSIPKSVYNLLFPYRKFSL